MATVPIVRRGGPTLVTFVSVSAQRGSWPDPIEAVVDTGADVPLLYPLDDRECTGVKLRDYTKYTKLDLAMPNGTIKAYAVDAWVRVFAPGEHVDLPVPVYFADVSEPCIGLELITNYFRVTDNGPTGWVFDVNEEAVKLRRIARRGQRP